MRKILLVFLAVLFLFSVNFISAFKFDNVGIYSQNNKVYTIRNAFGFGEEIGKVELISHHSASEIKQVPIGTNIPVMVYNVSGNLSLDRIEFINKNTGKIDKLKKYTLNEIKYRTKRVRRSHLICKDYSMPYTCHEVIDGYDNVNEIVRTPYNQKYTHDGMILELAVDVNKGDFYDGIFTFEGKRVIQHAQWNASIESNLEGSFNFNENTNTHIEQVSGIWNLFSSGVSLQKNTQVLPLGIEFNSNGDVANTSIGQTLIGRTNETVVLWIEDAEGQNGADASYVSGGDNSINMYSLGHVSGNHLVSIGGTTVINSALGDNIPAGKPTMLSYVIDSDSDIYRIYINDTLVITSTTAATNDFETYVKLGSLTTGGRQFLGNISDLKIFKTSLSQNEISQLYNNGFGLESFGSQPISLGISLDSPVNNSNHVNQSMKFQGSFTTNQNLTNATLEIYNQTNDKYKTNFTIVSGNSNSSTLSISDLIVTDGYKWNYYLCGINSSSFKCGYANENNTFNLSIFSQNAISYNKNVIEGSSQTIALNITIPTGRNILNASLEYNNTYYQSSVDQSHLPEVILTNNIIVPNIDLSTNISFFHYIQLNTGESQNNSINNQTIEPLSIDDCTTNTFTLLNLSLYDEQDQTFLSGTAYNTSIEVDISIFPTTSSIETLNYSSNFSKINPVTICLNNNLTGTQLNMDADISYSSFQRRNELYHIQSYRINSSSIPLKINLMNIKTDESTKFLITYKDTTFLPVEDALIDIQRKYIGEGVFKTVEIPKTDNNGQTVGYFDLDSVIYNIIVKKDGEILATFNNIAVVCEDSVIGDCKINLKKSSTSNSFSDYINLNDFAYNLNFNKSSRTITLNFINTDQTSSIIWLNVTKFDRFGNASICSNSLASSSGTLICSIPSSEGNISLLTFVYKDSYLVTSQIFTISTDIENIFQGQAYIFVLLLVMTTSLMFISSPIGIILGSIFGLIISVLLGLYEGSFISRVSSIIWLIISAGILIWRITKKENGI